MNLISSRPQIAPPAPFIFLAAPWLLQGVILICATRGHPPFFGDPGTDAYSSGSGPISGTAVYVIRIIIWLGTLFILLPPRRATWGASKERLLLLALPVLALISVLWSTAPKYTLGGAFDLFLLTITGMYIGTAFRPEQQMQIFMITGVLAGMASLLIAGLAPREGLDAYGHVGALKGIFTHKNACGFNMVLLATPALFLRRSKQINRLAVWVYGGFCVILVLLSQSRTAWIDLTCISLAAVALTLVRSFRSRDSYIIAAFALLAACVCGYVLATNQDVILALLGKDASFSGRAQIWQAVFIAITKRPILGYGYQAFFSSLSAGAGTLIMSTHFAVNHPHNGYLSIWINLGLVGLSLFLLVMVKAIRNTVTSWRKLPATDWYVCLIFVALIENFSEVSLLSPDDLSWLLFIVACTGLHHAAQARLVQVRSQGIHIGTAWGAA